MSKLKRLLTQKERFFVLEHHHQFYQTKFYYQPQVQEKQFQYFSNSFQAEVSQLDLMEFVFDTSDLACILEQKSLLMPKNRAGRCLDF